MILYHTSTVEIRDPDIHYGRKNADFGQGFYLTPDQDFTYRWAQRDAIVNTYELETEGLRIHRFTRTAEWFEYIFHNRRLKDSLEVDLVMGPIANDTIFDTMGIISSGFLESEEALRLLLIGPEYTQVVVKTQKAANQLKWLGSERIADAGNRRIERKQEQAEYQRLFAEEMEKLSQEENA